MSKMSQNFNWTWIINWCTLMMQLIYTEHCQSFHFKIIFDFCIFFLLFSSPSEHDSLIKSPSLLSSLYGKMQNMIAPCLENITMEILLNNIFNALTLMQIQFKLFSFCWCKELHHFDGKQLHIYIWEIICTNKIQDAICCSNKFLMVKNGRNVYAKC